MAKKKKTKKATLRKKTFTFGDALIDRFSPPIGEDMPKGINTFLTLEEALKLRLALEAATLDLGSYDQRTAKAKRINVTLYPHAARFVVNRS